jgi:hypothetical protein
VPLVAGVQGENLALLPALLRNISEHPQQLPVVVFGQQRRMIQWVEELPQAGPAGVVVPDEERPGGDLIACFPRTNLHRVTVTAPRLQESRTQPAITEDCTGIPTRIHGSASDTPSGVSCRLTCYKARPAPLTDRTNCRQIQQWASDLKARLAEHEQGRGARLLQVITAAGITWKLARTWPGDRKRERELKNMGGASRRCPECGIKPQADHKPPTAGSRQ